MDKEKRIKYLVQYCNFALKGYNNLSQEEMNEVSSAIAELNTLNSERLQELNQSNQENREMIDDLEAKFIGTLNLISIHKAFLVEKGLEGEYERFVDGYPNKIFGKKKPNLTLVQ